VEPNPGASEEAGAVRTSMLVSKLGETVVCNDT
jgi:hypothetical protein